MRIILFILIVFLLIINTIVFLFKIIWFMPQFSLFINFLSFNTFTIWYLLLEYNPTHFVFYFRNKVLIQLTIMLFYNIVIESMIFIFIHLITDFFVLLTVLPQFLNDLILHSYSRLMLIVQLIVFIFHNEVRIISLFIFLIILS